VPPGTLLIIAANVYVFCKVRLSPTAYTLIADPPVPRPPRVLSQCSSLSVVLPRHTFGLTQQTTVYMWCMTCPAAQHSCMFQLPSDEHLLLARATITKSLSLTLLCALVILSLFLCAQPGGVAYTEVCLNPYAVLHLNQLDRVVKSAFVHRDLFHLLANMTGLLQDGADLEAREVGRGPHGPTRVPVCEVRSTRHVIQRAAHFSSPLPIPARRVNVIPRRGEHCPSDPARRAPLRSWHGARCFWRCRRGFSLAYRRRSAS